MELAAVGGGDSNVAQNALALIQQNQAEDERVARLLGPRLALRHAWTTGPPLRYTEEVTNHGRTKFGALLAGTAGVVGGGGLAMWLAFPATIAVPAAAAGLAALGPVALAAGAAGLLGAAIIGGPLAAPIGALFAAPGLAGAPAAAAGLAYLGGGPIAAGGGGMAAGQILLGLVGLGGGGGLGGLAAALAGPAAVAAAPVAAVSANLMGALAAAAVGPAVLAGGALALVGAGMGRYLRATTRQQQGEEFRRQVGENELLQRFSLGLVDDAWELPRKAERSGKRWFDMAMMEWISYSTRGFVYFGTFLDGTPDGEGYIMDLSTFLPVFFGHMTEGRPNGECIIFHPRKRTQKVLYRHGELVAARSKSSLLCVRPSCPVLRRTTTVFLSHAHASDRSNARSVADVVSQQRGMRAFLDEDHLDRISSLPAHVRSAQVFVVFLSAAYFTSEACLVELVEAHRARKPVVVVEFARPAARRRFGRVSGRGAGGFTFNFSNYSDSILTSTKGTRGNVVEITRRLGTDLLANLAARHVIELDIVNAITWATDHIAVRVDGEERLGYDNLIATIATSGGR